MVKRAASVNGWPLTGTVVTSTFAVSPLTPNALIPAPARRSTRATPASRAFAASTAAEGFDAAAAAASVGGAAVRLMHAAPAPRQTTRNSRVETFRGDMPAD